MFLPSCFCCKINSDVSAKDYADLSQTSIGQPTSNKRSIAGTQREATLIMGFNCYVMIMMMMMMKLLLLLKQLSVSSNKFGLREYRDSYK